MRAAERKQANNFLPAGLSTALARAMLFLVLNDCLHFKPALRATYENVAPADIAVEGTIGAAFPDRNKSLDWRL